MLRLRELFQQEFDLTDRQLDVFMAILHFRKEEGYSPSIRELANHFGVCTNAIARVVQKLVKKGALTKDPRHARTLTPTMRFTPANPVDSLTAIG